VRLVEVLVTVVQTVLVLVVLGVLLVVVGRCIEGVLLLRRLGRVLLLVVLLVLVRPVALALVMVLLNCSLEEFLYDQSLHGLVRFVVL
jgi:hypothetical protein